MSPVPIIDLQRRLSIVGAIRCGEKTEKGAPRKLDTFRITSPSRTLIEQAQTLYGGTVTEWQSPSGLEWQVTTTSNELTVLVMPGYSLKQTYELWEGATKRTRVCDGQDMIDGSPCACETEGTDKCDLYTRLVVALPELDTVLGWRLITKGLNAGHEIPTLMGLIESVANGKPFVPAKLRLVERHGVKDGHKVRYVVPTLDLGAGYVAIAAASAAGEITPPRELGYTPVEPKQLETGVGVEQGLALAQTTRTTKGGRAAAPIADGEDDFDTAPAVSVDQPLRDFLSAAQTKKLNVLIGKLRPDTISTDQLWAAIARERQVPVDQMIELLAGRDDTDGVLHWSPLRDSLSKTEASALIDRLEKKAGEGS